MRACYCPICGHKAITHDTDGYDHYAISLRQSRPQTLLFLNKMPRLLESKLQFNTKNTKLGRKTIFGNIQGKQNEMETLDHTHNPLTNAEWAERIFQHLPQELVHGTCELSQHCHTCGSSIHLLVSSPDNPSNPSLNTQLAPSYCVYCGSSNTTTLPTKQQLDPMAHLALTYNLPELTCRAYFTIWQQQHPEIPTFQDFLTKLPELMTRPTIQHNPKIHQTPTVKYTKSTTKFRLVIKTKS